MDDTNTQKYTSQQNRKRKFLGFFVYIQTYIDWWIDKKNPQKHSYQRPPSVWYVRAIGVQDSNRDR